MPKRRSKRPKRRPTPGPLGWASLLLLLLVTFLVTLWVLRPLREKSTRPIKRPTIYIPPLKERPLSREKPPSPALQKASPTPKPKSHPKPSPPPQPRPPKAKKPQVKPLAAIIIDDMGLNPRLERRFFHLGLPLNFAFLPYNPHTRELAREAHRLGFEVLVHIPLASKNGTHPPGLITMQMGPLEIKRRVRAAVLAVPYAVGANHHEGSLFTADPQRTLWLLEEIKALGLFYIDSRTTAQTTVPMIARRIGLPYAERRVFLDHTPTEAAIRKEIARLISRAKKIPTVAIGHPHPVTLKVLRQEKRRLLRELNLVPISRFVSQWRKKEKR